MSFFSLPFFTTTTTAPPPPPFLPCLNLTQILIRKHKENTRHARAHKMQKKKKTKLQEERKRSFKKRARGVLNFFPYLSLRDFSPLFFTSSARTRLPSAPTAGPPAK